MIFGSKGRLWIHAASKVPDVATIKAMEEFYREIYAVDGVTDLKFPEHYPVSKLIGCVEIAGCLRREELASWKAVPKGARLEALTDFCWLCEQPQKLIDPLKMRGDQGVYNLEWKVAEAAVISLLPVESPYSIKFPLPNPANLYSLRPGSLPKDLSENNVLGAAMSPSLIAAIDDKLKGVSVEEDSGKTGFDIDSNGKSEGMSKSVDLKKQKQLGSNSSSRLDQHSAGSSLVNLFCKDSFLQSLKFVLEVKCGIYLVECSMAMCEEAPVFMHRLLSSCFSVMALKASGKSLSYSSELALLGYREMGL
uniref:Uncharacterized protein n=1 Tax=Chenopodium quinoa TaxID=63459 RepID=A0A803N5R7_CHEQI